LLLDKVTPCNAPFNNMYFTVLGNVSPCWKLPGFADRWSKDRSILDIWNGEHFQKYRDALTSNIFLNRCQECKRDIDNNVWPLAKAYEMFPVRQYPSVMELELSNQCNLECTMCSGLLSSGIRKNRDKLPPLKQIYDDSFIEQLKEFVPHLVELRFNGGEPFAQKIVLDICDMVAEINPTLKINIATNGTVYNKRVSHILANNNIHLNISIDSLIPERYEAIRINGNFNQLMNNFDIFHRYCKDNNRELSVMVNPMRNNWEEMVDFGVFARDNKANLWFNTILYPKELALWNLPPDQLTQIYNTLKQKLEAEVDLPETVSHLINNQIRNWVLDAHNVAD
jgi:MoaA/NifB/PqqE/SkfB family radical SAM enzyme